MLIAEIHKDFIENLNVPVQFGVKPGLVLLFCKQLSTRLKIELHQALPFFS